MNTYQPGSSIRISAQVLVLGVLTDPTTVALQMYMPGGIFLSFASPVHDGTGLYHVDYVVPFPTGPVGEWLYRWVTTGAPAIVNGVGENAFNVGGLSFPTS